MYRRVLALLCILVGLTRVLLWQAQSASHHQVVAPHVNIALTPRDPNVKRILFVGNSYTFVNDLPATLRQIAAHATPPVHIEVDSEVCGGCTLQNHADKGHLAQRLQSERWDYVVLQEQSQRPAFARAYVQTNVLPPALRIATWTRQSGAEPVLFMTWGRLNGDQDNMPGDTFAGMQQRLSTNYKFIGEQLPAQVIAVGDAWQRAHMQNPSEPLWANDGSHPSVHGTYLGACVFAVQLLHIALRDNTFSDGLTAGDAAHLRDIAAH